jgi:hypothetical protein
LPAQLGNAVLRALLDFLIQERGELLCRRREVSMAAEDVADDIFEAASRDLSGGVMFAI